MENSNSSEDIHGGDTHVDEPIYNVEKILDRRVRHGRLEYFLKWQGCPDSQNTWEPFSNLNCSLLVSEFEEDRFPTTIGLLERGAPLVDAEPDKMLGIVNIFNEKYYLMTWPRPGGSITYVKSEIANQRWPAMVINFYDNILDSRTI